jgi:hypothetical protein
MVAVIAGGSGNQFLNIAGAATTIVAARAAELVRIVFNKKVVNGVVTIYDSVALAAGTKVGTITNPATLLDNAQGLEYGVFCQLGIVIVTSAADDITVVWR